MALTRSFRETVKARIERDGEFRDALFSEAIRCLLSGEVDTGQVILRDYVPADAFANAYFAILSPDSLDSMACE